MLFSKIQKDFMREQKSNGVRSETLRYDEEKITPIIKYFTSINISDLNNLKRDDVYDYIDYMRDNNNTETTINKKIAMLKRLIRFAINEGDQDITGDLNKILEIKKSKVEVKSKHTLTKVEVNDLFNFYDKLEETSERNVRLKAILSIALSCGFRFNEIRNIKKENVSLDDKFIKLTYTKTGKARFGILTDEAVRIIKLYMDNYSTDNEQEYLFVDMKTGKQLSMNALVKVFQRLTDKLNIKISICGLRHTFASHLLMNGADIETVRRSMGHTRLTTTQIYLDGITDEHIIQTFNQANIFANKQKYATI